MVYEKPDPDQRLLRARRRAFASCSIPEQTAGLDSEEGRSLNFTCGDGATALLVDSGERARLVEVQTLSLRKTASQ